MLAPLGSNAGQIQGKQRIMALDLPVVPDAEGVIARLRFRAVLGNDSVTSIEIKDQKAIGGNAIIEGIPGEFKLLGICYTNGQARLVNTLGNVALSIVRPNPTAENIEVEVETIERGISQITLYDPSGYEIKRYVCSELPVGKQTLHLDLNGVGSGRYILVLQTTTVLENAVIEVQR
jgi:hypothetical protein